MTGAADKPPIIKLDGISKRFVKSLDLSAKIAQKLGGNIREEIVHAVDRVSMHIYQGEVVGLAGESGCGKSTLGRIVAGILSLSDGTTFYKGSDISQLRGEEYKQYMLNIQMIFQDPFASLNPRKRIRDIIIEAPLAHEITSRSEADTYLDKVMLRCGLDPADKRRFPHQFSGGQRQRIGIARALAVKPEFIVCDEAVAALDVSIQAQILNLFMKLREELHLTYLFISHDLGVVEHISDRILIMYLGRVVESARTEELFAEPNHPYTKALLREVPRLANRARDFMPIEGEIPSSLDPPSGCHFHPRCPYAENRCCEEVPALREIGPDRLSACHLNDRS